MYRSISESDFVEGFNLPVENEIPDWFKETLYLLGVNTKSDDLAVVVCTHRNAKGVAVTCRRWSGPERLDNSWIKSGYASDEAVIASSPFMKSELRKMSKRLSFDVVGKEVDV